MTSAPLFQVECGTADKPASSHVGPIPGQCTLLNAPALPVSLSSSLASLPRVKRDFTRREVAVQACDRPTHTCSMYMLGGLRHGLIVDCTSLPDRPPLRLRLHSSSPRFIHKTRGLKLASIILLTRVGRELGNDGISSAETQTNHILIKGSPHGLSPCIGGRSP